MVVCTLYIEWPGKQDIIIIMEKKVSLQLLCGIQHSVIMADFLMLETQLKHNSLL